MLDHHRHFAVDYLRICKSVPKRIDGGAGHSCLLQKLQPLRPRSLAKQRFQKLLDLFTVLLAPHIGPKAWILCHVRPAYGLTQPNPKGISKSSYDKIAIGCAKRPIRNDIVVPRPNRLGLDPRGKVSAGQIGLHANERIE
jgi:hypothetical protein